jgi:hypothetical protein
MSDNAKPKKRSVVKPIWRKMTTHMLAVCAEASGRTKR